MPHDAPGRLRRTACALALLTASFALVLVGVEVLLRLFHPVSFMAPVEQQPENTWAGFVHRASAVPGLAYELAPGITEDTRNGFVRTNGQGMRDDEPLPPETPGLLRVAAVGDSYTFGFKVDAADAYPNVVERMLATRRTPRPVEVLNLGVGGYAAKDEALVVRYKALPLRPRLILLGYVLNDPEILPFQPLQTYFESGKWYRRFHITRLALQSWFRWATSRYGHGDYVQYLHAPAGPPWRSVEAAFADIGRAAAADSVPVLVVVFPLFPAAGWDAYRYGDVHARVVAAAHAAGLDALDLLEDYRAYEPASLAVAPDDAHPSVLGHRIAAQAIVRKLECDYPDLIR